MLHHSASLSRVTTITYGFGFLTDFGWVWIREWAQGFWFYLGAFWKNSKPAYQVSSGLKSFPKAITFNLGRVGLRFNPTLYTLDKSSYMKNHLFELENHSKDNPLQTTERDMSFSTLFWELTWLLKSSNKHSSSDWASQPFIKHFPMSKMGTGHFHSVLRPDLITP